MKMSFTGSRGLAGWERLERLRFDLKYALGSLRKGREFAALAVLTLALGIGANTAVFSVVNAVVFRPLPYRDAGRLTVLWENWGRKGKDRVGVSPDNYLEWKRQSQSYERMAAVWGSGSVVALGEEPAEVRSAGVGGGFFETLGVKPLLGRAFLAEEHLHADRVAVVSYRLWQRLGGRPETIGSTVQIDRKGTLVVGIMPPAFAFPPGCQVWTPLAESELPDRSFHYLMVAGKLKPGLDLARARAELDTIALRLRAAQPAHNPVIGVTMVPLREQIVGDSRQALVVLLGAVGCVLLIACANVANLLLTRASRRKREIALRLALGAARWRIVRMLLLESVILALAGGVLGVAWAYWSVRLFVAWDPLHLPRLAEIAVDRGMLLFTFGLAVSTGVIFGLAPALRVSRPDLNECLKEGAERQAPGGPVHARGRNLLAISQIALAIVLLVGGGLLLRSFVRRVGVPLGFRPNGLLAVELPNVANRQIDRVLERIRALPGVRSAGAATAFPQAPPGYSGSFAVGDGENAGRQLEAGIILVTPDYFRTAGMALREGRFTGDADTADAPKVAVVNEALVRRYFRGQSLLGHNVQSTDKKWWRTVVGVVADAKSFGVDGDPMPTVYVPYRQNSWNNATYLIVQTAVPPAALASAVRKEIRAVSTRWVLKIDTIEALLAESVAVPRFYLVLVGALAGLALVLAAIGIYGVVGYSVAQRKHEFGVRMALGAARRDVLFMVLRESSAVILVGVALGLMGAWASTRALESLLFQVHARDAVSFAMASVLLAAVALAACFIPARHATKIDPMIALRHE
ncbi:MAG: ABC transporter permease [Acidobacteriia bacterium]|nr:ABC transporter permease [Terriglobia bacterium]